MVNQNKAKQNKKKKNQKKKKQNKKKTKQNKKDKKILVTIPTFLYSFETVFFYKIF